MKEDYRMIILTTYVVYSLLIEDVRPHVYNSSCASSYSFAFLFASLSAAFSSLDLIFGNSNGCFPFASPLRPMGFLRPSPPRERNKSPGNLSHPSQRMFVRGTIHVANFHRRHIFEPFSEFLNRRRKFFAVPAPRRVDFEKDICVAIGNHFIKVFADNFVQRTVVFIRNRFRL